jgi:GAF domain-containing protein
VTDPDDIVTRLRAVLHNDRSVELMNREAADEIERLRKELADAYSKSVQVIADLSANLCTASALERERLTAERDEARRRTNSILTEIDCRIEHGAESNGHLEALRDMFKEDTDE